MKCCVNTNAGRSGRKPQLSNVNGTEAYDTAVAGSDSTVMAASSSVSSPDELEEYPLALLEDAIANRHQHMSNNVDADVDNVGYAVPKILTNFAVFR